MEHFKGFICRAGLGLALSPAAVEIPVDQALDALDTFC